MANTVTSYFFPPEWDFEYGGAISIGNIISDPKEPQYALNRDERLDLPPFLVNKRRPFKATITVDSKQSAGVNMSLLSFLGFDGDSTFERSKKQVYTIEAKERLTQQIDPDAAYVEACFKQTAVAKHLQKTKFKDLYMIIGIMAATSATVTSQSIRRRLFGGKLGVDFTPAGAPVGAGIHGSVESGTEAEVTIGESDFILAYRLRKITYLKEGKVKKMADVLGNGTVLHKHGRSEAPEKVHEAQFVRLEEKEIGSEEFEFTSVKACDEDDGKFFELVIPVDEK